MWDRIRYVLRIAAVAQQLAMPSFAVTAPADGADAVNLAPAVDQHSQRHFVWPANIAALRYRGLARGVMCG